MSNLEHPPGVGVRFSRNFVIRFTSCGLGGVCEVNIMNIVSFDGFCKRTKEYSAYDMALDDLYKKGSKSTRI